jgi:hypothetical protein
VRVLAAYNGKGWIQAWTVPADPAAEPETAYIPGGPFAAAATVAYKGPAASWESWAGTLAQRSPYDFWFAVVDVPDSALTVNDALSWLRSADGLFPPA